MNALLHVHFERMSRCLPKYILGALELQAPPCVAKEECRKNNQDEVRGAKLLGRVRRPSAGDADLRWSVRQWAKARSVHSVVSQDCILCPRLAAQSNSSLAALRIVCVMRGSLGTLAMRRLWRRKALQAAP